MRRLLAAALCALLTVGSVAAEEKDRKKPAPPLTPEQAADAVRIAIKAEDKAALKALADAYVPDPWIVADALWARGELDAALRLATATRRRDLKALPAYLESLRNAQPDSAARTALAEALAAQKRGDRKQALARSSSTKAPAKRVLTIRLLHARGSALRGLNRFEESRKAYHEAGVMAQEMGWLAGAAQSFHEALMSAYVHSDYRASLPEAQARLAVERERELPHDVAATLGNVATVQMFLGRYEEALQTHLQVLETARELRNEQLEANTYGSLGSVYLSLMDLPRAVRYIEQSLALQMKLRNRRSEGGDLGNLGVVFFRLGRLEEAAERFERALAIAREVGDGQLELNTINWMGNVAAVRGDHTRALLHFEDALRIARERRDRLSEGWAVRSLAHLYERLGALARARQLNEDALALAEAQSDPSLQATSHSSMGVILVQLGDLAGAEKHFVKGLAIARSSGDQLNIGHALSQLGGTYERAENFAKAREYQTAALAHATKFKDTLLEIFAHGGLASIATNEGHHAEARKHITKAQELAAKGGLNHALLDCLVDRASIESRAGNNTLAIQLARDAVELLGGLVGGLAEEQAASVRGREGRVYEIGALAAVRAKQPADVTHFLESGRAGALLESLNSRDALRATALPAELEKAETAGRAEVTRAHHAFRRARTSGKFKLIRERRAALDASRNALKQVIERIQREAKSAAEVLYPKAASLARVQAELGPQDALLLYGVFSEASIALVVSAADARVVSLGPTQPIRDACASLRLGDVSKDPSKPLAALKGLVLDPLKLPKEKTRLLVSAQGELSYVPVALLAADREVASVPSGTTYALLRRERALRGSAVLGLGDPDYESRIDRKGQALYRKRSGNRLTSLPGTRKEIEAVADVRLLGAEATEAGLTAALKKQRRWRAVHLACHGLVNPENPMFSSLALTVDEANDGFLTCFDVFRMKIPADLVVLSACETGKGRVVKAEGIVGLTRAFMFAGAPRVLCSLWKVDDEATGALMAKFYELWNPKSAKTGLSAAAALKRAQAFVRSHPKWKHPHYWAAWVLWGLPD